MFYVYAIKNKSLDKIYIGCTSDLEKRLARHNHALPNKKTSYTSINKGEWKIFHQEEFLDRVSAIKREKELKSFRGREFLKNKYMRP